MDYIINVIKQLDLLVLIPVLVLLLNSKTRNKTIKMLGVLVVVGIYHYVCIMCRDLEVVKMIINIKPMQIVELCTTKVRFTSSKALPDFKNVNLAALLRAIVSRIYSGIVSPIKQYVLWIREVLIEFIKIFNHSTDTDKLNLAF